MTIRIEQVEVDTRHFIGGEPYSTHGRTFEVFSPIDQSRLGDVSAGDASDVEAAVCAARASLPVYRAETGFAAEPSRKP